MLSSLNFAVIEKGHVHVAERRASTRANFHIECENAGIACAGSLWGAIVCLSRGNLSFV